MMVRFIGDVHGKFERYKRIIADCDASVQVGDLGIGFRRKHGYRHGEEYSNPPHYAMVRANHRFIRGNHDNPSSCKGHSQWIADGTIENGVMFVGGAVSVDQKYRTQGFDWWADEELAYADLCSIMDRYIDMKPHMMVSHDCPENIANIMTEVSGRRKIDWPSRTRQAFATMFDSYQPKTWIFGHWHHSFDRVIEGTRFICLAELEYIDLDM